MSEEVFRQDLDENKAERAGGPFVIELLFREPADMPSKERMSAVIEKHVGKTECFCHDGKTAGFAALDYRQSSRSKRTGAAHGDGVHGI